jgi:cobalt-zinc-cadmium resistance protein CzcA
LNANSAVCRASSTSPVAAARSKRYEIHLDVDAMKTRGITLSQIQNALSNANMNVGADFLVAGQVAMNIRSVGLFGGGSRSGPEGHRA